MSEYGLPCIICGKSLRNVWDTENQPKDGICVQTTGNYGSTKWDSFNGEFLEFNICDPCLVEAAKQERVWVARAKKPVAYDNIRVGWARADYLPVPWRPDMEPMMDEIVLWCPEELDDPPAGVTITYDPRPSRLKNNRTPDE